METSYPSSAAYYSDGALDEPIEPADYDACMAAVEAAETYLAQNEAAILQVSTEKALAFGRIALLGLRSWEDEKFYLNTDVVKSYEARDIAMAEVFQTQREHVFPEKKSLIWAHNFHIEYASHEVDYGVNGHSMGHYLRQDLGEQYLALGLTAHKTEINWPGVGCGSTAVPSAGSAEDRLSALGQDYLFVDLAFPGATSPLFEPDVKYEFGIRSAYHAEKLVPADQFTGIVFLKHSPPMEAALWDACETP